MGIKVLFLDVDGVLNTFGSQHRQAIGSVISNKHVGRLRDILAHTGAYIVLSTAWRNSAAATQFLYQRLKECGIPVERVVIGKTPNIYPTKRSQEIQQWLKKCRLEVDQWVAIDDMNLAKSTPRFMDGHFVNTDANVGMTKTDAGQMITILNSIPSTPPETAATNGNGKNSKSNGKSSKGDLSKETRSLLKQAILQIVKTHAPHRVERAEHLLKTRDGRELELYLRVCRKYGVSPDPSLQKLKRRSSRNDREKRVATGVPQDGMDDRKGDDAGRQSARKNSLEGLARRLRRARSGSLGLEAAEQQALLNSSSSPLPPPPARRKVGSLSREGSGQLHAEHNRSRSHHRTEAPMQLPVPRTISPEPGGVGRKRRYRHDTGTTHTNRSNLMARRQALERELNEINAQLAAHKVSDDGIRDGRRSRNQMIRPHSRNSKYIDRPESPRGKISTHPRLQRSQSPGIELQSHWVRDNTRSPRRREGRRSRRGSKQHAHGTDAQITRARVKTALSKRLRSLSSPLLAPHNGKSLGVLHKGGHSSSREKLHFKHSRERDNITSPEDPTGKDNKRRSKSIKPLNGDIPGSPGITPFRQRSKSAKVISQSSPAYRKQELIRSSTAVIRGHSPVGRSTSPYADALQLARQTLHTIRADGERNWPEWKKSNSRTRPVTTR